MVRVIIQWCKVQWCMAMMGVGAHLTPVAIGPPFP